MVSYQQPISLTIGFYDLPKKAFSSLCKNKNNILSVWGHTKPMLWLNRPISQLSTFSLIFMHSCNLLLILNSVLILNIYILEIRGTTRPIHVQSCLQFVCNPCVICVQSLCNLCAICVQTMCIVCAMRV